MTLLTKHGSADLWLERHLIVLAAVVADDLESGRSTISRDRFLGAAFQAALRSSEIALIKGFLFFLSKKKRLFTLHTRSFYIGHRFSYLKYTLRMPSIISHNLFGKCRHVRPHGITKGIEVVTAFHARHYPAVTNFVSPLHHGPRHPRIVRILKLKLP